MTDNESPATTLDNLARVLDLLSAAAEYGFSVTAAARAAVEVLADAEHEDAITAAALLAALVACDLRPLGPETLEKWREGYGFHLACRDREP